MPEWVDSCVTSLVGKWKSDPSSRPTPKEKGQDAKGQAFAICQSAAKKRKLELDNSLALMLEDGHGPTLIGAAATNRPYIPQLKETVVTGEGEDKRLVVHLANPGKYDHPLGPFTLNRAVFLMMTNNFKAGVLGQKAAYDCKHKPNEGAFGWFEKLYLDEKGRLFGLVDPTATGLAAIEDRQFLYSSLEFHRNFKRDDVRLDLERATEFTVDCMDLKEFIENADESTEVNDMGEDAKKLEGLQDQVTTLEQEKKDALDLAAKREQRAKEAEDRALKLEQRALDASVASVVSLAKNYRDKDGRGHSRVLIKWVDRVLRLGDIGEDENVVRLSDDEKPNSEVMHYLLAAVTELIETLPAEVPTESDSSSDSDDDKKKKDNFDYKAEWEN